jgi:peptidoglycan/LPS O-acetylase OafA/YrhL
LGVFGVALYWPELLHSTKANWSTLLKSLLFIPYRKESGAVQPVLFLGWTLNYEMFFYLIYGAVLLSKVPRPGLFTAAIILVLPATAAFLPHTVLTEFYTQPITFEFALGIAVYHLVSGNSCVAFSALFWWALLGLGLVALPCSELIFGVQNRHLLLGLPAGAVVLAGVCLERKGLVILNRYLLLAGNASYVLYLTHPYVLQLGEKVFRFPYWSSVVAKAAAGIGFSGLSVAVACVAHVYLEKPMTQFLNGLLRNRRMPLGLLPVVQ